MGNTLIFLSVNRFFLVCIVLVSFIAKDAMAQSSKPQTNIGIQQPLTSPPPNSRIIYRPDGAISYLRGSNLSSILEKDQHFRAIQSLNDPKAIAVAFLHAYKNLFGVQNPANEFVLKSVNHDDLGYKQVRLGQVFLDIPVWNAEILVQLNQANHISLVQGQYIKTPSRLNVQAKLNKRQVIEIVAKKLGIDSVCQGCILEAVIYQAQGKPLLAFKVSVTVNLIEGWTVIVGANSGIILNKIPTAYSGSAKGRN